MVRKSKELQKPAPTSMTTQSIRDQIPAQYFKQNTLKSTMYVLRDFTQIAITGALMYYGLLPATAWVCEQVDNQWFTMAAYFVAWNIYAFVQGLSFTGLWVLAHEAGHRAFSPSLMINDAVGMVLHSALLVPYHSWRISHGNHHKHTNHMTKDTVFVPDTKAEAAKEAVKESPIVSLIMIFVMLTLGWPGYLLANMAGQKYDRRANHFEPMSPLFRPAERPDVAKSDVGLLVAFGVIAYASSVFGFANVCLWYGSPYLWTNAWLVFITYLQHSDVRIPHYTPDNWNFVRGALSTVDRDFGFIINWFLHHIQDSHVVHHLFSTMPFYNAIQVTRKHIKPILGEYYVEDNRSLAASVFESWTLCRYVVPSEGIMYFKQ